MVAAQQHPFTSALTTLINAMHPPATVAGREVEITHRALAEDIADTTGFALSANYLWKLRTGQTVNPSFETLDALRVYFGLDSLDPLTNPELAVARGRELALVNALKGKADGQALELVLRDGLAHGIVRAEAIVAMLDVLRRIEAEHGGGDM
ncbi:hypothetical protein LTV02_19330 [Nocardia yamanashiensis]|uniref:hypothetical protein n=1 Tax=Nocardia yamanashiensis TaxID=209247 RepID=UPI001E5BEE0D|nr:hypothetical protein [Nocardia yamanashiensis]UGT45406.1 hypothetical protein LTV02_19330 [Nocardia yamanashiensis]